MTPEIQAATQRMIDDAIKNHRHDGALTQVIYLNQVVDPVFGPRRYKWSANLDLGETSIARKTNGVTAVNVFFDNFENPITCPYYMRVNAMYVISLDTTAGTISLLKGASTVGTVAKGTVSGVMTGSVNLDDTLRIYVPGNGCGIVSSSAGNAIVILQLEFSDRAS